MIKVYTRVEAIIKKYEENENKIYSKTKIWTYQKLANINGIETNVMIATEHNAHFHHKKIQCDTTCNGDIINNNERQSVKILISKRKSLIVLSIICSFDTTCNSVIINNIERLSVKIKY